MTSTPFQPKGAVPEWRLIYDNLLLTADFGDIVSFENLDRALGRSFRRNRSPIYRARREMAEMRSRWIEAVPRIGYQVIEARDPACADGQEDDGPGFRRRG